MHVCVCDCVYVLDCYALQTVCLYVMFFAELVGACIITFLATVIFEGMKLLKVYLSIRQNENPLDGVQNLHSQERIDASSTHDEAILLSSLRFPATVRQIRFQK